MMPTELYIHAILYDVINDIIFDTHLPIHDLTIKYRNKVDNSINDIDELKYSGKIKNTGDDGIILLGCL